MKSLIKKILQLPFRLLYKVKINQRSVLTGIVADILNDKEKIELAKRAQFNALVEKSPPKGFKIVTFLNALQHDSNLASKFTYNLVQNLHLYESQLGQDCIVDSIFSTKSNGIFVEIGVGEGKAISNTYFLEKYRNWTGILCEPSVKFHPLIRASRTASLVTQAIYDQSGLILNFSEVKGAEELSTLSDFRDQDTHQRSDSIEYEVSTITFNEVYEKMLPNKRIDYLSIDTEGSELLILSAIDFKKIDISVISVEHNYNVQKLQELRSLLTEYEYLEILPGVFEFDAVFAKKRIVEAFYSFGTV